MNTHTHTHTHTPPTPPLDPVGPLKTSVATARRRRRFMAGLVENGLFLSALNCADRVL